MTGLKRIILLVGCLSVFLLLSPVATLAEEETDDGQGETSTDGESQEEEETLKKEVEAILAETDDQESERLMIKKAFCGNLVSHQKTDQKLLVEVRGEEKTVSYDDDTVMVGITREKITPEDLETGNYLVAMGYVNRLDPGQLSAKRLVVQETPAPSAKESFFGLVGDISSEEEVFILTQGDLVFEVSVEKADISYQDEDDKLAITNFARLQEGDKVIVIGQRKNGNGRIEATRIHIAAQAGSQSN